jgi:hypothetical protein
LQPNIARDVYRISMRVAGQGAFHGRRPRDDTSKFIKPRLPSGRVRDTSGAGKGSRCFRDLSGPAGDQFRGFVLCKEFAPRRFQTDSSWEPGRGGLLSEAAGGFQHESQRCRRRSSPDLDATI